MNECRIHELIKDYSFQSIKNNFFKFSLNFWRYLKNHIQNFMQKNCLSIDVKCVNSQTNLGTISFLPQWIHPITEFHSNKNQTILVVFLSDKSEKLSYIPIVIIGKFIENRL